MELLNRVFNQISPCLGDPSTYTLSAAASDPWLTIRMAVWRTFHWARYMSEQLGELLRDSIRLEHSPEQALVARDHSFTPTSTPPWLQGSVMFDV
jgi:hypothetical protein